MQLPGPEDLTASLSDELLLKVLQILHPNTHSYYFLVCKRWLRLLGLLKRSIKLKDWSFLESGSMTSRFPNLTDIDLTTACLYQPSDSPLVLTNRFLRICLSHSTFLPFPVEKLISEQQLSLFYFNDGLRVLAEGCRDLQRLCVIDVRPSVSKETFYVKTLKEENEDELEVKLNPGADTGLAGIFKNCYMLQELELHHCDDESLNSISVLENLQILHLVSSGDENGSCSFTDIGLTKLAHSCKRLVKLELSGCEGSYAGIAAIGKCCVMLEELTLSDHKLDQGWIAALSSCVNLKTLRFENCKKIDSDPGPVEHIGSCNALERLQLERCNLRDVIGFGALVCLCSSIKELEFQDCWGLEDDVFKLTVTCKSLRHLSLEGCSLLSASVLETVLVGLRNLESLHVDSCNNIRDSEITPSLASLFVMLKELKWRPDTKSLLAVSLAGTGIGQKGGRILKCA